MEERRRERIEDDRLPNAIIFFLKGIGCFVVAVLGFMFFQYLAEHGGRVPTIVALLHYTGGRWWFAPVMILIGIYQCVLGVGTLTKVVDVDDQADLPEHF